MGNLKKNGKLLARGVGYVIALLLILMSAYLFLWAIQSASFSVAAGPVAQEVYKMRAEVMLPISFLSLAIGILYLYVLLRDRQSNGDGKN